VGWLGDGGRAEERWAHGASEDPKLQVLVRHPVTKKVQVPQELLTQWGLHPTCGPEFQAVLLKLQRVLGYVEPLEVTGTSPDPKRKGEPDLQEGSPEKRLKTISETKLLDQPLGPCLLECKLANLRDEAGCCLRG
jgi:hypothetical protein